MVVRPALKATIHGLGNNALVYFVGLLLSNTLTFMSFPILAKSFSKGEFGLLDFYFSIGVLVSVLLAFGIDSSIGRLLHEVEKNEARSRIICQAIIIQSILIFFVVFILYKLTDLIYKDDLFNALIFKLIIIQAGFQAFINIALNLLKWTSQKWKYIILSVLSAGLGLICISVSIFVFTANLIEVLEAILISKILSSIIGFYLIYNLIEYKNLRFTYLIPILKYALPIGVICILEVALPVIERESILRFLSKEELGQYAAAAKFIVVLAVVVQAFQTAWGPFSLSTRNQEMSSDVFVLVAKLYVFLISICSLVLLMFGKFLLIFLTSTAYQDGWFLIFPMSIILIIQSVGSITGIGLIISNRPYIQLIIYLIFFMITCLLISILTKKYGIFGTAGAILMANVMKTVVTSWLSQYFYFINWPFKTITIIILINLLSGLIIVVLMLNSLYLLTLIFFILAMISIYFYFWIYALSNNEKKLLHKIY